MLKSGTGQQLSRIIIWKKYGIRVQRIIFHMLENVVVGITDRQTEPALTLESDADIFPLSFLIVNWRKVLLRLSEECGRWCRQVFCVSFFKQEIPIYIFFFSPITGLGRPWRFQEVEAPRFQDSRYMKVVRLSALRTGRLYPPGNISGTHFC